MNPDESPQRWLSHGPMTDPGDQAGLLGGLPSNPSDLCAIVAGLLIHGECLPHYGLPDNGHTVSRATLPASERLARIRARDDRPLWIAREPAGREITTCRDFAVMLCTMLRVKGIPARVRCGFAAYLGPNPWEDHWICERWVAAEQRWAAADAELDAFLRAAWNITFDPADLPAEAFITAGEAWLRCRSGALDPGQVGHGDVRGLWFLHVNVMRDHRALHQMETSSWDSWRQPAPGDRHIPEQALARLDEIARCPEARPRDFPQPPWL
jgi:hypothetical protein